MTEAEVRDEVSACGLDHLGTTRLDLFINFAARRLYNTELWPFRSTTQTGTAPLTVTDLGPVKFVKDSDGLEIEPRDMDELSREVDLTESNTSVDLVYWYFDDDSDVNTWPASSQTITVRHFRLTPTDTADILAAIPDSFHYLIVSDAVRRGKIENNEPDSAIAWKADYDDGLKDMKRVLFNDQVQMPKRLNDL